MKVICRDRYRNKYNVEYNPKRMMSSDTFYNLLVIGCELILLSIVLLIKFLGE